MGTLNRFSSAKDTDTTQSRNTKNNNLFIARFLFEFGIPMTPDIGVPWGFCPDYQGLSAIQEKPVQDLRAWTSISATHLACLFLAQSKGTVPYIIILRVPGFARVPR